MREIIIILLNLFLLMELSQSRSSKLAVDELADQKTPTSLHVGDSVVFKHNHLQNLYLFHSTPADASSPASPPALRAPPPTAGGEVSSRPSSGWGGWASSSPSSQGPSQDSTSPLIPKEGAPSAAPTPAGAPESGGDGIPFLNSNPAVPLPTGMTDTASIRPLPTPGDGTQAVGLGSPAIKMGREWWLLCSVSAMACSAMGLWM